MRILVVEDEEKILNGIVNVLKKNQAIECQIYTAFNGLEAWEKYANIQLDLIITDIQMQEMNGLDMLELFSKKNTEVRFIVISGYDDFSYAQKAIRLKVVDYLLKPVEIDTLNSDVQKIYNELNGTQKAQITDIPELKIFEHEGYEEYPVSLRKVIDYMSENYVNDMSLQFLAERFMLNPSYLSNLINKYTGSSFCCMLDGIRLKKAAQLLLCGEDLSIHDISRLSGYSSERRLYHAFQKWLRCTPGEFKQKYDE